MARKPEDRPSAIPTSFPDTTPQLPGADYSYTVELVGNIKHDLGKLTEAVENLKVQVGKHDEKLGSISADIHTAKITVKVIGAILTAAIALTAWAINKGVDAYVASHQNQTATPSTPTKP